MFWAVTRGKDHSYDVHRVVQRLFEGSTFFTLLHCVHFALPAQTPPSSYLWSTLHAFIFGCSSHAYAPRPLDDRVVSCLGAGPLHNYAPGRCAGERMLRASASAWTWTRLGRSIPARCGRACDAFECERMDPPPSATDDGEDSGASLGRGVEEGYNARAPLHTPLQSQGAAH